MAKILVLTDVHLRGPEERIIGLDPLARFEAALDAALAAHPDAGALVITGDLAHAGRQVEYERLRAALDGRLPEGMTLGLMIGNHDRREAFREVFPEAPVTEAGHVQRVIDLPGARLVLLDTLEGPPYGLHGHAGRLGAERMAWLEAALAGAGERPVVVFAHHPPMEVGFPSMDAIRLLDGEELLWRLRAHPGLVHLVCGHIHRTISGVARGVAFTIFKSPCHQMPIDLTGTDSTISIDEPGAFGLLLVSAEAVVAHSEDVGLPRFEPVTGYGG